MAVLASEFIVVLSMNVLVLLLPSEESPLTRALRPLREAVEPVELLGAGAEGGGEEEE